MTNDNYYVVMTRFLSATNHRGRRIKANDHLGSVIFHYDHALSYVENHREAAKKLLKVRDRLSEDGKIVGGAIRTRDRVWMQIPAI